MSLITIDRHPSRIHLRTFGILLALFVACLGAIAYWQFAARLVGIGFWGGGALLVLAYCVFPAVRRPLYLAWMYGAFPIGWIVSHLLLASVFYVVLTGTALLLRLTGWDPMRRKFDRQATTYWTERPAIQKMDRYFRQF